jgi:hypothetical protein
MDLDDVTHEDIHAGDTAPLRIHLQFFEEADLAQSPMCHMKLHNCPLQLPADLTTWPRAVVFDFVYGAAALNRWYSKGSLENWEKSVNNEYNIPAEYIPEDDDYDTDDSRHKGHKGHDGGEDDDTVRFNTNHSQHSQQRLQLMAMDLVLSLWNSKPAFNPSFVKGWLQDVSNASTKNGQERSATHALM